MTWQSSLYIWYLYLFGLGVIFFPITSIIFRKFADKGYPFAKTIAIILLSYSVFLTGILHILPFSKESIMLILAIIGFFSFYIRRRGLIVLLQSLSLRQWMLLAGEELLFFISLASLFFVRSLEPSIHGLEKFMDYGFMQSILRSRYFPPLDMWYSADPVSPNGYPINYYYFGHLSGAVLTKLTEIPSAISYNLILATIFAQGITLAFSWSLNAIYTHSLSLGKKIHAFRQLCTGIVGALLVNLAGNLHTIYLFTKGYPNESPIPFWTIWQNLGETAQTAIEANQSFFSTLILNSKYWYPNATRFIPFTIHEFPSYSYVVADLHGHVFDIPFVLSTLGFILAYFSYKTLLDRQGKNLIRKPSHPARHDTYIQKFHFITSRYHIGWKDTYWTMLFGSMVAIHYMTNAFDGPIYILLIAFLFLYRYRLSITFIYHIIILGTSYVIISLPFSAFFTPFVTGIGVNCSPEFLTRLEKVGPFLFEKGNCQLSELWMLFVLWGFFLISCILFLVYLYLQKDHQKQIFKQDTLVLIIFAFGSFLIAIPEFFYIKDIYPAHFRANTMFKMGYQAYIMMSLASAYIIARISLWCSGKRYVLIFLYAIPLFLVTIYFYFAFPSYYPGLDQRTTYKRYPDPDGIAWLKNTHPQDLEIVNYINTYIQGQPVILEAQGDSYTDYNRISAYTGTPTVAGWWVHEWLWRGSSEVVGNRIPDIAQIYESPDLITTKNLLKKYNIEYVVISKMEQEKYPNLMKEKFSQLGVRIFESSDGFGALYKVY